MNCDWKNIHKALLNELLRQTSQAIMLLNKDAEILFSSQSIRSITGYESEEVVGRNAIDLFQPVGLPAEKNVDQYLTRLNEKAFVSLQIRNKQGQGILIDADVKNMLGDPNMSTVFILLKSTIDLAVGERKIVQAVTDAKEQERQFLASELHDNINQIIAATKLLVDAARVNPEKEDLLRLTSANLELVTDEIRKLSYSMASFEGQDSELASRVHSFLSSISRCCAVIFKASLDEEVTGLLTSEQQLHVYRIIQEATNNIIRHAGATEAQISLTRRKDFFYLLISDDGEGFSMNRVKTGMGLSSIANRVKLLEGHFHVGVREEKGTTIEILFPGRFSGE
jgi:PAS domain S-box-containing protein